MRPIILLLLATLTLHAVEKAKPASAQELCIQKLETTIIPVIDFQNITFDEAFDFLRLRMRDLDRDDLSPNNSRGISFVVRTPVPEAEENAPSPDGFADTSKPGARRINNYQAKNISVAEALRELCRQAKLSAYIPPIGKVTISAQDDIPKDQADKYYIIYQTPKSNRPLRTREEKVTQNKLDSITLKNLNIKETELTEAIRSINKASKIDHTNAHYINIIIRKPPIIGDKPEQKTTSIEPKVSLSSPHIPFSTAVDKLCQQANYTWTIEFNNDTPVLVLSPTAK